MNNTDTIKPLWLEGTILTQQHFQVWDSNIREREKLLRNILEPFSWGILECEIDQELLLNGIVNINKLLAIFPKGEVVNINRDSNLQININSLDAEIIDIYVEWEKNNFLSGVDGYPENTNNSWYVSYKDVEDAYDPTRVQEIAFANKKCRIYCGHSLSGEEKFKINSLHVLRLVKKYNNNYCIDEKYIYPSVFIVNSLALINYILNIEQVIKNKLIYLEEIDSQVKNNLSNINIKHGVIWYKKILIKYYSILKTIILDDKSKPIELYKALTSLFFNLDLSNKGCGLSDKNYNISVKKYNHLLINNIFNELSDLVIQKINDISFNFQNNIIINKISKNNYKAFFGGLNLDSKNIILAINNLDNNNESLIYNNIKVSAPSLIEQLIISSTSGVKLDVLTNISQDIVVKSNYKYFQIVQNGVHWEQIKQEKDMMIFVTDILSDINIELLVTDK